MKIIEFFGLPYSGKTHFSNYLKKIINKKSFSAKTLLLYYLINTNKFNLYVFFSYIKNFFFYQEKSIRNYGYIQKNLEKRKIKRKFIFKKLFYPSYYHFIKEKEKIFLESKFKYSKFYNFILEILEKEKNLQRRKRLKRWLKDEIIAIFIAKEKNLSGILIMSECFIQRIHSYHLYKDDICSDFIDQYLLLCPKSDIIFYVNTEIELIKQRLKKYSNIQKVKFYLENFESLKHKNQKIMNKVQKNLGFKIINNSNNLDNINI